MNKLALRLVLFSFLLFLPFAWLEHNLTLLPNTYLSKRTFLEQQLNDIEILTVGSSHAVRIDPRMMSQRGFNLALVSQDFYYDSELLRRYLPRLTNLKVVIVPVSYFSLQYRMANSAPDAWRQYFYYRVWDIRFESNESLFDLRRYSYIALYGKNESLDFAAAGFQIPLTIDETGRWIGDAVTGRDNLEAFMQQSARQRIEFHHSWMDETLVPYNVDILRKLIDDLQTNGVEVVFVTLPVFHTYSDLIDASAYDQMQRTLQQLTRDYEVEYFNYFYDPRFTIEDFRDSDHLSMSGSTLFTGYLNDEVLEPMLARITALQEVAT